ncbi:MAG TPA: glycosyltransferase family 2 protein [Candidatus Sulfotelmatobacter sp.]|nr:glycosyltransferase family 2 protein [Candidatus Sulfotelmatobacter sp.]
MILSVVIITHNEEANIGRTLESVKALVSDGKGEIVIVDSGSTDRTMEIAKSYGAKVFVEEWKGYAAQKNSAITKATGDWILSLDADEELDPEASEQVLKALTAWYNAVKRSDRLHADNFLPDPRTETYIQDFVAVTGAQPYAQGIEIRRRNFFLGRWIKHGGFWPDPKLRLFRRGGARFEDRAVHEDVRVEGRTGQIRRGTLIHHSYPTLSEYIEHMNRYSSLGAEMAVAKGIRGFSVINIVVRPLLTFIYNYFLRLGFLDGREGLLLHLYHAVYVSWKYAKVWELSRK